MDVWCLLLSLKGHLKKKEQGDNMDGFFSQDDDEVEPEEEPSKGMGGMIQYKRAPSSYIHTYL